MNNNLITKNNALIEAAYRLSLTEMQIVVYGISLINPVQKDFPLVYRIEVVRFAEMFDRKHGEIYSDIKDAIKKRFWERDFSYVDNQGKTVTCRWLTRISYQDKTGFIEIKFSEDVQPYLHQMQKQFTTYYIDKIARFKSIYSIRFYEYSIMQLKKTTNKKCTFSIEIKEIKRRLDLEDKYKRFSNFKADVLESAKKEINKYSDVKFSYEVIKQGRTPHKIKFTVSEREHKVEQKLLLLEQNELKLTPSTIEKGKEIIKKAGTRWDIYAIEQQFYAYAKQKGIPKNPTGAFLGFVKKKAAKAP